MVFVIHIQRRWIFLSFVVILIAFQLWNSTSMATTSQHFFSPTSTNVAQDVVVSELSQHHQQQQQQPTATSTAAAQPSTSKPKRKVYYYDLDLNDILSHSNNNDTFVGVKPRAFEPWTGAIPCANDGPRTVRQWGKKKAENGLFFLKPVKTGSSTGVSMHLRIASNEARRRRISDGYNSSICPVVYGHNIASEQFPNRNRTKSMDREGGSFLWSILRDPTSRMVSSYFFHRVSRKKENPVDSAFQKWILGGEDEKGHWRKEHYMHWLSLPRPFVSSSSESSSTAWDARMIEYVNDILQEYDFIGVTERMDETAVTLAMLLGLSLADVLYLSAKQQGGWDDGAFGCAYLVPSFVSLGMEEYFQTPLFQNQMRWDHILHQAANRSLDLTIDRLGRATFEANLAQFRQAQKVVEERCLPRTVFPCSASGRSKNTTCLYLDTACSFDCLDEVANDLSLWDPTRVRAAA